MIIALRWIFAGVLVAMLMVTSWASLNVALWNTPRAVATHPWFIATLFDTYFAFLTFYLWVTYKERRWIPRIGWLIAILLLGNIAMAIYMLIQLFRLPKDASLHQLLQRQADSKTNSSHVSPA
jgi:membrane-associated phospholipid phosphatase